MSDNPVNPPNSSERESQELHSQGFRVIVESSSGKPSDENAGWSVLLSALAIGFALWATWIVNCTSEKYRGRTDLDMPDWFVINMDLTIKVIPLGLLGVLCLLVSGGLFLGWASRASRTMRVGFVVQWLVSAVVVGLVLSSRLP